MAKIPLKINISQNPNHHDIKKALNLSAPQPAAETKISGFWMFSALILFCFSIILAGFLLLQNRQTAWEYADLIPQNYQVAAFLNLSSLPDLGAALIPGMEKDSAFFRWFKERAVKFMTDSGLKASQVVSLFEDRAIFTALPQEGTNSGSWVFLAKNKPGQSASRQNVLGKMELVLKKDFFLNELFYRQVEIKSAHSLANPDKPYFYAQADDYVLISNNQASLQNFLDKIIQK